MAFVKFLEMETWTSMFFVDRIICGLIEWNTKATQTWGGQTLDHETREREVIVLVIFNNNIALYLKFSFNW